MTTADNIGAIMNEMCSYDPDDPYHKSGGVEAHGVMYPDQKKSAKKTKRLRCPECGRRIVVGPLLNHDGDFVPWQSPSHKVKGWYKPKRRKKVERRIKRV
jgi:hypothetical protein